MTEQSASTSLALLPMGRLERLYGHTDRQAQEWIRARRQLQQHGIDAGAELAIRRKRCGFFFGLDRVRPSGPGRFEFDEGGAWHVILPELRGGEIVDLVAFRLQEPPTMRSLRGTVTLLGEEEVEGDRLMEGEVTLWDDPLHWLRAQCQGGVVVSLDPLPFVLEGARLATESMELAQRLEQALTTPRPAPRIRVVMDDGTTEEVAGEVAA